VLEESMRAGFEAVYRDYPGFTQAARYVVSDVKIGETWGGEALDPRCLPESLAKDLQPDQAEPLDAEDEDEEPEFGELEDLESDPL
jgi:hypothetical protein